MILVGHPAGIISIGIVGQGQKMIPLVLAAFVAAQQGLEGTGPSHVSLDGFLDRSSHPWGPQRDLIEHSLEVGLTAKFSDAGDELDRLYVCLHKCNNEQRCPARLEDRIGMARQLSSSLQAPLIVSTWLDVIEASLTVDADAVPQLCVGSSRSAGKLYLIGTDQGRRAFPNVPVSASVSLHSYLASTAAGDGDPEVMSIEWPLHRSSSDSESVVLRRYDRSERGVAELVSKWRNVSGAIHLPSREAADALDAAGRHFSSAFLIWRTAPYDSTRRAAPPAMRATKIGLESSHHNSHQAVGGGEQEVRGGGGGVLEFVRASLAPNTASRAAAWLATVSQRTRGLPYIMDLVQLGVDDTAGGIIVALYAIPSRPRPLLADGRADQKRSYELRAEVDCCIVLKDGVLTQSCGKSCGGDKRRRMQSANASAGGKVDVTREMELGLTNAVEKLNTKLETRRRQLRHASAMATSSGGASLIWAIISGLIIVAGTCFTYLATILPATMLPLKNLTRSPPPLCKRRLHLVLLLRGASQPSCNATSPGRRTDRRREKESSCVRLPWLPVSCHARLGRLRNLRGRDASRCAQLRGRHHQHEPGCGFFRSCRFFSQRTSVHRSTTLVGRRQRGYRAA